MLFFVNVNFLIVHCGSPNRTLSLSTPNEVSGEKFGAFFVEGSLDFFLSFSIFLFIFF